MKVHLKALGCRLNEAELARWSREFISAGHQITNEKSQADVVVLNSCAVTVESSAKSRRLLNRLHRENPQAKLVATGCYATLETEAVASQSGVDMIVSNDQKDNLPAAVMREFAIPIMPVTAIDEVDSGLFVRGRHRAFIKVQDGCRYRCTYCIVTVARGDERSRPLSEVVEEVRALHNNGVQEVVLTGVHVGGYGSDLENIDLKALVQGLLDQTDIPRIRFASVEPWDLPDDFFELFRNPRVMPHMHLPMQSGCDRILRRMSRRCKTAEFEQMLSAAREQVPHLNITTDIIVGFPGETEDDWTETLAFVERCRFSHIHIFSYSARAGTKAASLADVVPSSVKRARSQALHQVAAEHKSGFLAQQIGQQFEVLLEREIESPNEVWAIMVGYTDHYAKVWVKIPKKRCQELENTIQVVSIVGAEDDYLLGALA